MFLFGIILEESKLQITPPRERNEWLMLLLCKLRYSSAELLRLNRVQMYQDVLFLLDVMDAREVQLWISDMNRNDLTLSAGLGLDFLSNRLRQRTSTNGHALLQLRHIRTAPTLGRFTGKGHKIWEWRYSVEKTLLFWFHDGRMDIYTPSEVPRYANRPNCWTRLWVDQQPQASGSELFCLIGHWLHWGCGK